jgi:hypothetical protein
MNGHFDAQGLTHVEITRSLEGHAEVRLEDVNLGGFDPVIVLARDAGMDLLDAGSRPVLIPYAVANLQVQDREVVLKDFSLGLSGAELRMGGTCAFDGTTDLQVRLDLSGLPPRWFPSQTAQDAAPRLADLHFAGPLDQLQIVPSMRLSQKQP